MTSVVSVVPLLAGVATATKGGTVAGKATGLREAGTQHEATLCL